MLMSVFLRTAIISAAFVVVAAVDSRVAVGVKLNCMRHGDGKKGGRTATFCESEADVV
jgi:archaellin